MRKPSKPSTLRLGALRGVMERLAYYRLVLKEWDIPEHRAITPAVCAVRRAIVRELKALDKAKES